MEHRVAMVVGATSDIGQAVTAALVDRGAQVLALGRDTRMLAAMEETHRPCVDAINADLTTDAGVREAGAALGSVERLDLLVLGAGVYERSSDAAGLRHQLHANVEAPYALLRLALPALCAGRGTVVVLNSTQGLRAAAGVGAYAATQHAMKAVTDSLRDEVNDDGVRVCSIYLGRTASRRQQAIFAMEQREYRPHLLVQPQDVADVVLAVATLGRTAEITDVTLRPAVRSY